jgi:NTE family protein
MGPSNPHIRSRKVTGMPKRWSLRLRSVGLVLLCIFPSLQAAERASDAAPDAAFIGSGPRIGLALSGGGARGLAHIGVIKVLEELRVPVHCVTGTSMGAVVGGIYASGVTSARMHQVVSKADWNQIFSDSPPRREISMRRKADDYKTLFAPEFGWKDGGLAVPKGVLAGVSIETFFRSMTGPAGDALDFGTLPIPFRAMAADIATGEAVVLDCVRACRCRVRWRPSKSTASSWSTAASSTIFRSNRRASSAPTSSSP